MDKYYPRSFCDTKMNEFLRLVQGSMYVAEYEKRYTELAKYAMTIIADETHRCKRFEEGLRKMLCTPITVNAEWTNFSKLVEATMRVEKSLLEEKTKKDTFKGGR